MALDRTMDRDYEGLPAMPVLAMALFEQAGLTELIDSIVVPDTRKVLTPGNAVKAMVGAFFRSRGRQPLYMMERFYLSAPVDLLFGPKVNHNSLGDRAFERDLDDLFEVNLPDLIHRCYGRLCSRFGLESSLFNIDCTNFTITVLVKDADRDGATIPQRCGHAKDGHNDRLVYSMLTVTDDNGIVCYERPYDGATSDSVMDRDAIEYLSTVCDPHVTTLIGDCKIVTAPLIELMASKGFGFVSKCPNNFGEKIRQTIVDSVESDMMVPSTIRDGWELYDTDAVVDGRELRFIAYRTDEDVEHSMEYLRTQGRKEAESLFNRFASKQFNCEEDARREFAEVLKRHRDSAYVPRMEVVPIEVKSKYGKRGRPPKDWVPEVRNEYRVDVELVFDDDRAQELTKDRCINVLITNLPRPEKDVDNIREGADADTVLRSYLGQYKVEHAFRLMKSGFGLSTVYLHKPSREDSMMAIISLATMVSDVIHKVLKDKGIDNTAENIANELMSLNIMHDRSRGTEFFRGSDIAIEEFLTYADALGIDTDHLYS